MTRAQLRAGFVLVIVVGVALSWIQHRAFNAGANHNELKKVRAVLVTKVAEGKVVQGKRLEAGKAVARSHAASEQSRPAARKGREALIVVQKNVDSVSQSLRQPITDLLSHDDNLERENADLRQLATVDTTVVKNLTEQLGLKQKELELTPKPERCGRKCGIVIGVLLVIGAAAATK